MKAKEFKDFIATFANVLREAGANDQAEGWHCLATIFEAKPGANVADICKALTSMERPESGPGSRVAQFIRLVPAVESWFAKHGKKAVVDDLKRIASTLSRFSDIPVEAFVQAAVAKLQQHPQEKAKSQPKIPSAELVLSHLKNLQSAVGDEIRFPEVFSALKQDKRIRVAEAKQLAREFAELNAKTKGEAFDLIWHRHASVVGSRARARATAGRTAA